MKGLSFIFFFVFFVSIASAQSGIQYKMVVAQDGSGDFETIQSAIDATKAFPDKRITIFIKNGIYNEKVKIPSWNNLLSLIGEDLDKTIITFDDFFSKMNRGRNSTFMTSTVVVEADDFMAENITIINSAGKVGQAVALHVEGNRCVFRNCKIQGNQDTLYLNGENSNQLYQNCTIEGTTDFIFGSATAVFRNCEIVSKKNSYITAASTTESIAFGFVFMNCKLSAIEGVNKVYLGRPWRLYAKTAFINCSMGEHIKPEGWHNWGKEEADLTTFYAEYNNDGLGANTVKRVNWAHQLTAKQAKNYTVENILGNWVEYFTNEKNEFND